MKKSVSGLACILWLLSTMTVGAGQQSKTNQPAQARPDFSGKWVLDFASSKLGRERALLEITAVTLLISHQEPVLTFTETTDYEGLDVTEKTTCYTDERGETNRKPHRSMLVKSKTRWKDSQLVTKSSRDSMFSSYESDRSGSSYNSTGEWGINTGYGTAMVLRTQHLSTTVSREISADGRTLTVTTSTRGPESTQVVKQVFNREPSSL